MKNKWNTYFYTHYKPIDGEWGIKDLESYRKWYTSWILHINNIINFKNFPQGDVLEIGSGIGAVASLLKEKGFNITGSDISTKIVAAAQKVNKNIPFVYCDIQKKLPDNKKYNLIFGFEVLEHLKDPLKSIEIIKKGLKPGGYFIGSSPYPYKKNFTDPTHCSVKYPEEWEKLFEKSGFSDIQISPMSFLPGIWRIHKKLNIPIPFYISLPAFVSTTLIIAKN